MGIVALYSQHQGGGFSTPVYPQFGTPYLLISVSLNILLTLMIVVRLVLHGRQIRAAAGSAVGISGLYKTISTMLVESCALFAVNSLVVVGALIAYGNSWNPSIYFPGSYTVDIFFPIVAETQVGASPRPRSQGQLSNVTTDWAGDRFAAHCSSGRQPERVDEPHYYHRTRQFVQRYEARGPTGRDGTPLGGHRMSSAAGYRKNPGEPGVGVETSDDRFPSGQ